MPRLRCPNSGNRALGQRIPVENRDLLEMGRDGFRRREAPHSGSDDDGVLGDRIGHRRPPKSGPSKARTAPASIRPCGRRPFESPFPATCRLNGMGEGRCDGDHTPDGRGERHPHPSRRGRALGRWSSSVTAFPKAGTRGDRSWRRWRRPATTRSRRTCEATARPTVPKRSKSTRSFTWLETWSGSSMRSASTRPSSPATTGARRSPGTLRSCGRTGFAGSSA